MARDVELLLASKYKTAAELTDAEFLQALAAAFEKDYQDTPAVVIRLRDIAHKLERS